MTLFILYVNTLVNGGKMGLLKEEKARYEKLTCEGKRLIDEKEFYLSQVTDKENIRIINVVKSRDENNLIKYQDAMAKVLKAKDATRQVILLDKLDKVRKKYESHLFLSRFTTICAFKLVVSDQGYKGRKEEFFKTKNNENE